MTANITPTIITSKLFLGAVLSTQLGNVAWNDDGQCLFLTKRGATVMVGPQSIPLPTFLSCPYICITRPHISHFSSLFLSYLPRSPCFYRAERHSLH